MKLNSNFHKKINCFCKTFLALIIANFYKNLKSKNKHKLSLKCSQQLTFFMNCSFKVLVANVSSISNRLQMPTPFLFIKLMTVISKNYVNKFLHKEIQRPVSSTDDLQQKMATNMSHISHNALKQIKTRKKLQRIDFTGLKGLYHIITKVVYMQYMSLGIGK